MFVKMRQAWNGLPCGRIVEIRDGVARDLFDRNIAAPLDDTGKEKVVQILARREKREKKKKKQGQKLGEGAWQEIKAIKTSPRNKMVTERKAK
jgi:hypothetical protein